MAEADALAICNEALVLLGDAPIDSLDGEGAANVACRTHYGPTRDHLLSIHPWNFSRLTVDLVRLAAAPSSATGFSAAYQLPTDLVRIVRVFVDTIPDPSWSQEADHLLVDAADTAVVAIEYHRLVDESYFIKPFRTALMAEMAARLAPALTEREGMTDTMQKAARVALATARHANATQRPTQHIAATRFIRARAR